VEIDIRNLSQHPLLFWPEAIKAIHFQAERPLPNQLLPEFDFLDEMGAPGSPGQAHGLVTLQPGHSYRYSIALKNDFFKNEGYYKVSLEYDGSSRILTKPESGAPSLFDGHLESNWLIFQVEECEQPPAEVSLCELVSKCTQYDLKRVRVRAEFISDGLEYSALVDPSKCSKGIQPWTSKTVDQHADIKALDAALTKGYRGTNDKQILGTFTGRYECGSASGTGGPLILQLQSVESMIVKPRKVERSGRRMSSLKTDR